MARFISSRRTKEATEIYAEIGGKSPILEITNSQAEVLQKELKNKGIENKVFVCMRYWHPMTAEVVSKVKDYNPDKIFLLPLYPQYSTTTTKSSLDAWFKEAHNQELNTKTKSFVNGLNEIAKKNNYPFHADSEGGMFGLYFTNNKPKNIEDIKNSNIKHFNKFFNYMLSNGVFFAPSAYEAGFISEAHTQKDFSEVYKLFTKFIKSIT